MYSFVTTREMSCRGEVLWVDAVQVGASQTVRRNGAADKDLCDLDDSVIDAETDDEVPYFF